MRGHSLRIPRKDTCPGALSTRIALVAVAQAYLMMGQHKQALVQDEPSASMGVCMWCFSLIVEM